MRKISTEEMRKIRPTPAQLEKLPRIPVVIVLDNLRSAHNVGSIFRTADGMRAGKIILAGTTPTPHDPHIQKTALGATEVVPWEHVSDTSAVLTELKKNGYTIIALELTHDSNNYCEVEYPFPVCIVVGNEIAGISEEVLALADICVSIPMLGRAHSLNVANATAIILYELLSKCHD